jgi:hypothetical protein
MSIARRRVAVFLVAAATTASYHRQCVALSRKSTFSAQLPEDNMRERAIFPMVFVAALSSRVVGGVLFALARLPPAQGIAAIQAINTTVINPGFIVAFLGPGVMCLILIVVHLFMRAHGTVIVLAGMTYLLAASE